MLLTEQTYTKMIQLYIEINYIVWWNAEDGGDEAAL